MLLVGAGAKLASLQALIAIRSLGDTERVVARVEAEALRIALAARDAGPLPLSSMDGARLAARLAGLAETGYSLYLERDPMVAGALSQLKAQATPERLAFLQQQVAVGARSEAAMAELDSLALLATSVSDTIHNAATLHIEGLWARVLILGGGAVIALIVTSLGGSTLAAVATARVDGFVTRIDDYRSRLREADADKAEAVAAAELAAIARTEAMVAESTRRLNEALALAEAGQTAAETDLAGQREASEGVRRLIDALHRQVEEPVNGIRDIARVMKIGHVITMADRRNLEAIETSGEGLLHLSASILDIVRLDRGQSAVACEPFRPELAAEAALQSVARLADRRDVHIVFSYDEDGVESYLGDQPRITQVIANLLRDAVLATAERRVTLDMDNSGASLVLTVCDRPSALAAGASDAGPLETLNPAFAVAADLVGRMRGRFDAVALLGGGRLVRVRLDLRIVAGAAFDADAAADRISASDAAQRA